MESQQHGQRCTKLTLVFEHTGRSRHAYLLNLSVAPGRPRSAFAIDDAKLCNPNLAVERCLDLLATITPLRRSYVQCIAMECIRSGALRISGAVGHCSCCCNYGRGSTRIEHRRTLHERGHPALSHPIPLMQPAAPLVQAFPLQLDM